MIYLRQAYATSGLAVPRTVAVYTPGLEWVDEQVAGEFARLFPETAVALNPRRTTRYDLHVLVEPESAAGLVRQVGWACRHRHAEVGVGFYCLNPRSFEVLRGERLWAWAAGRLLHEAGLRLRRRFLRPWALLGFLYRRCASFS